VLISRGLNFVGKYIGPLFKRFIDGFVDAFGSFLDGFYNDHDSKYVNFLHQVVGIAITYGVGSYVYGWSASFGLPAAVALTAVAALIGYLAIGSIVGQVSNMFIGVAGSIAAAAAVVLEPSLQVFSGWFLVAVQAVLTALLAGLVVIPLAYRVVKFVANPLLASWLSEPLTNLHRSLRRELFSANSNTYSDKTGLKRCSCTWSTSRLRPPASLLSTCFRHYRHRRLAGAGNADCHCGVRLSLPRQAAAALR
jgi:hypothetical protein